MARRGDAPKNFGKKRERERERLPGMGGEGDG